MAFACVGNTIKLRSGGYLDLSDPDSRQISVGDIAGALSKICRFGGQIERWYSVAEHSIHCARQAIVDRVPWNGVLAVLLHDATEAYVGDVVKPLKMMLTEYGAIESGIADAVGRKFGVSFEEWAAEIRDIDQAMLIAERKLLWPDDGEKWTGEDKVRKLNPNIKCMAPFKAEAEFLSMFEFCRWATSV